MSLPEKEGFLYQRVGAYLRGWLMEKLHCLSYCLQMADKRQKATKNVNAMNI